MQAQVKRLRVAGCALVGALVLGLFPAHAAGTPEPVPASTAPPAGKPYPRNPGDPFREKLKTLIVPKVEFKATPLEQAVAFMRQRSKELDPTGEGINLLLQLQPVPPAAPAAPTAAEATPPPKAVITLALTNVSLWDLVRYVAIEAGIKYRIERNAALLFTGKIDMGDMETRTFPIRACFGAKLPTEEVRARLSDDGSNAKKEAQERATAVERFFAERGVDFPPGASMSWDPHRSRLLAYSTPDNLERIGEIVQEPYASESQVEIHVSLTDGKNQLMGLGVIGISGETFTASRTLPPPTAVPPATDTSDAEEADDDDAADDAAPEPLIEHKLDITPTVDSDNYTINLKFAWEAAITPKDQAAPRQLKVDTTVLLWDGATLSFPVAAAGEIAGHGELTLQIRATIIDPAGQPVRGKK